MWEQIRSNKRRTVFLMFAMLFLLALLGFAIGSAVVPSLAVSDIASENIDAQWSFNPLGGILGVGVALIIWIVMSLVAFFAGDRVLLAASGAKEIEKEDHPQLFNVVEEMTIASSLGKVPRIYVIDDMAPNAFATGRKPENASVAVTAGLLGKLNRDQLQGVMAHEIAHVVNRDVLLMTMAGVMVGSIVMMSDIFLRGLFYSGRSRRYSSSRSRKGGGGGAQIIMIVVAVVIAILAPILAQMIYFAISRRREYLADASASIYTRYPEGLAGALEIIAGDTSQLSGANRATAPMYIINPLHKKGMSASEFTRTHPPVHERIEILRGFAGGVSYRAYQNAWSQVDGKGGIPASALDQDRTQAIREAHPDSRTPKQQTREAGDMLRNVNKFLFLPCACGLRLKLPPDYKKESVDCPRCGRHLEVPVAQLATLAAAGAAMEHATNKQQAQRPQAAPSRQGKAPKTPKGRRVMLAKLADEEEQPPLKVQKAKGNWMTFKCSCGTPKNLAPTFAGTQTKCNNCGRTILVENV